MTPLQLLLGLCLAGTLLLPACGPARWNTMSLSQPQTDANWNKGEPVDPTENGLISASFAAADHMVEHMRLTLPEGALILPTSFAPLGRLEDSPNELGRLVAQQIASRLVQHGFKLTEPRLGNDLRMGIGEGELILTRDVSRLAKQGADAQAVLVGTYAQAGQSIFVSARMVRAQDSTIIASVEYYLPKNRQTSLLLPDPNQIRGPYGPASIKPDILTLPTR